MPARRRDRCCMETRLSTCKPIAEEEGTLQRSTALLAPGPLFAAQAMIAQATLSARRDHTKHQGKA